MHLGLIDPTNWKKKMRHSSPGEGEHTHFLPLLYCHEGWHTQRIEPLCPIPLELRTPCIFHPANTSQNIIPVFSQNLCVRTHILVDAVRNLVLLINVTIFHASLITQSHAFLESNIHISPNHEFLVVMYTGLIWYIHWQQGILRWCKGYEEVVMTWAVVGMQLK
jgi:hypothetical protein